MIRRLLVMSTSMLALFSALILCATVVYSKIKENVNNTIVKDISKVSVAGVLAIVALVISISTKGLFSWYTLIPLALLIAAVSDYVLEKNFIIGMGIFSLSYVLFPIGFFAISHVGFHFSIYMCLYAVLVGIIGIYIVSQVTSKIQWIPILAFMAIHFVFQVTAIHNAIFYNDPFIFIGAFLLFFSDVLLSIVIFLKKSITYSDEFIMGTYWFGLYYVFYSFTKILALQ
jgi:hypothetical protein